MENKHHTQFYVTTHEIDTIIFDLGNVLIDFDHNLIFKQVGELTGLTVEKVFHTLFVEGVASNMKKAFFPVINSIKNFAI